MNTRDPVIHRSDSLSAKFTDDRLTVQRVTVQHAIPWPRRLAAIAVGDVVAGYVATLPFTHLDQLDPSLLPFTQFGLGLFPGYALTFFIAGLLPSLLMARVQLQRGYPPIGVAAIWGVVIGLFVYALATVYFARQAGWLLPASWIWAATTLIWPALITGALGGLAGWGYLTLLKKHLSGWA